MNSLKQSDEGRGFAGNRRGNVATIFAFALIPLSLGMAAAVDYALAASARGQVQAALDAAVLTGMRAPQGARAVAVRQAFAARFPSRHASLSSLTVQEPRNGEPLRASAVASVSGKLTGLFGQESTRIGVASEARFATDTTGADARASACILVTDNQAPQALTLAAGASVVARRCQAHVRSNAGVAAYFGGARLSAQRICLAGAGYQAVGSNQLGPIAVNCRTADDPYGSALAAPASLACMHSNRDFSGDGASITLSPGVYCGRTQFGAGQSITLAPGHYVLVGGAFDLPSGAAISGRGVTFYFADIEARLLLASNVRITLAAPSGGAWRDVLMHEPAGLAASAFDITADGAHHLDGLIHLPSRHARLAGPTVAGETEALTIVVGRLSVAGSAALRLAPGRRRIEVPDSNGNTPQIAISN
jgi:Flp pilus assembly protein TadG